MILVIAEDALWRILICEAIQDSAHTESVLKDLESTRRVLTL